MTPSELDLGPVLGRLATYLIHSTLWVSGAWLVARRVDSAAWRERLWRGALLGGVVTTALVTSLSTTALTWGWTSPVGTSGSVEAVSGPAGQPIVVEASMAGPGAGATRLPALGPRTPAQAVAAPASPATWPGFGAWLVALWLGGALLGLGHLAWAHRRLARALRDRRAVADGPLAVALARLQERSAVRRRVRLSTSPTLASPIALARGEIVVPERALERLGRPELETLVAHELAHLARRDPLWLLALHLLRRVLWVQPLLGVASERLVHAAEIRCDELAARWTRGELALARCLAEVATWIEGRPARHLLAGMAEQPSALVERVERLLKPRHGSRRQGVLVGLWLAAMLGGLACGGPEVKPEDQAQASATTEGEVDGQLADIEARIREKQAQMDGLKPQHSRYKLLAREIAELELQRDQLLLNQRIDAGEQGELDTRGGSKLHVSTITQGGMSMSTAAPHALRLHADGSIECANTRLVSPADFYDDGLVDHLHEIALGMDRTPLDPAVPDGVTLPSGSLRVLIDVDAPHSMLQRVLQVCSAQSIQIWKFSLVPVMDGEPGQAMPFALPHDLARIPEAVEEGAPAPLSRRVEVTLRVVGPQATAEGGRPARQLEYDVGWNSGVTAGAGGIPTSTAMKTRAGDLEKLGKVLGLAYEEDPRRGVVIDALPGALYADVRALLDVVIATGFTDITFTGRRE